MTKIEGIILDIIPTPSSVNETYSQMALEVYPNPVSDVLHINNIHRQEVEYAIFNVLGQMVTSGSTDGNINVADLTKGLYVLQIKDDKYLETTKFMVK